MDIMLIIITIIIGLSALLPLILILNQYTQSNIHDIQYDNTYNIPYNTKYSCLPELPIDDKSSIQIPGMYYSSPPSQQVDFCYSEVTNFSKIREISDSTYEFILERGQKANLTIIIDKYDTPSFERLKRYVNNPELDNIHLYRYEYRNGREGWINYDYDWYNKSNVGIKIYQSYSEVYLNKIIVTYTIEVDDNANYATYNVKTSIIPYRKVFLTIPFKP
ncbi:MAG: hypothetical protein KatS3mg003_1297 [Candidatus Nitrosocaldaceae archaeon]|nr:MAG: hypothetical protein KatS3mg003_1297 [Candidatus Nitrosocaldaceae archaeon]